MTTLGKDVHKAGINKNNREKTVLLTVCFGVKHRKKTDRDVIGGKNHCFSESFEISG